jgi:hypothetical protein
MRSFVFGAALGAIAMYFYLQGFGPIIGIAQGWWLQVSSPHAMALHQ